MKAAKIKTVPVSDLAKEKGSTYRSLANFCRRNGIEIDSEARPATVSASDAAFIDANFKASVSAQKTAKVHKLVPERVTEPVTEVNPEPKPRQVLKPKQVLKKKGFCRRCYDVCRLIILEILLKF